MSTIRNQLQQGVGTTSNTQQTGQISAGKLVSEHISSGASQMPLVYSAFLVKYSDLGKHDQMLYCLTPNQVVPVWSCEKYGKARGYSLELGIQMFMWSALAYDGKLYAEMTEQDNQIFSPADYLAGKRTHQDNARLMTPGGSILHNVQYEIPWMAPLKSHPKYMKKVRIASPKTLASWTDEFGNAEVVPGECPPISIVAYDDNGPVTLYDPINRKNVKVRILSEMPFSMEYVENSLNTGENIYGNIERAVIDYLTNHAGDPKTIGIAWTHAISSNGVSLARDSSTKDHLTTKVVYYRQFNNDDHTATHRLSSDDQLAAFATGSF